MRHRPTLGSRSIAWRYAACASIGDSCSSSIARSHHSSALAARRSARLLGGALSRLRQRRDLARAPHARAPASKLKRNCPESGCQRLAAVPRDDAPAVGVDGEPGERRDRRSGGGANAARGRSAASARPWRAARASCAAPRGRRTRSACGRADRAAASASPAPTHCRRRRGRHADDARRLRRVELAPSVGAAGSRHSLLLAGPLGRRSRPRPRCARPRRSARRVLVGLCRSWPRRRVAHPSASPAAREALLQRFHEVDDLGARRGGLGRSRRPPRRRSSARPAPAPGRDARRV